MSEEVLFYCYSIVLSPIRRESQVAVEGTKAVTLSVFKSTFGSLPVQWLAEFPRGSLHEAGLNSRETLHPQTPTLEDQLCLWIQNKG